jgi:RNA polymerase sigma-70 factor (ECF subfamily)
MEPPAASSLDEAEFVARLRDGNEAAYSALVDRHQASMLRLASTYVPSRAVAEEVVQDAWLGVLKGLPRFEGRSSLRTWIFRILVNTAKSRGIRERRSVPFSSLGDPASTPDEPAVDPDRFHPPDDSVSPGAWSSPPSSWEGIPHERLLSMETRQQVEDAIAMLPPNQQVVIRLRDIEGWSSSEVCNALDISETNQRVLLHRARSKVRRALERYLDEERATA